MPHKLENVKNMVFLLNSLERLPIDGLFLGTESN